MKLLLIFIASVLIFSGCNIFDQKDLVDTQIISKSNGETIFCNVFKTGLDNYKFEFCSINNNDTLLLFESYLNDAKYKEEKFKVKKSLDTIIIDNNLDLNNKIARTKNGSIVMSISQHE